jgi:hypothetical protein
MIRAADAPPFDLTLATDPCISSPNKMWPTDPEYGLSPKNTIGIDVYNPPPVSHLR